MKLYIWKDAYRVDYGGACLYVVASSVEEARALALDVPVSEYGYAPCHKTSVVVDREPDRILDLPCAEVYEWSE